MAHTVRPQNICTASVQSRIGEFELPITQEPVNDVVVENINDQYPKEKLLQDLGILVDENGVPETTENVPRIFVMTQTGGDEPKEEMKDLQSAGIVYGSKEFWSEVQKGNVFVYPAGISNPVQMQLDTERVDVPRVNFSTPIEPDKLPLREEEIPEPPAPSRILMWLNKFGMFKKYAERHRIARHNYEENRAYRKHALDPVKQNSTKRARSHNTPVEVGRLNTKFKDLDTVEKAVGIVDIGKGHCREIYGLHPVQRDEFTLEKMPARSEGKERYTQEQFNELKPINMDMSSIRIGQAPADEEDFVAVGMFSAMQYKHMKNYLEKEESEADWMIDDLKRFGIEHPEQRRADSVNTMISADLVRDHTGPRERIGSFFKDVIEPGREEARTIFENYKKAAEEQDPEKRKELKSELGAVIAFGINSAANYIKTKDTISSRDCQIAVKAERLIQMMKNDPELEKIAQEKGLNQEKLKAVNGVLHYNQLAQDQEKAMLKLKTAAFYGKPLTDQEKKECTRAIIKADTFKALFANGFKLESEKGEYKRNFDKLTNPDNYAMPPLDSNGIPLPWKKCPKLEGSKIYLGNPLSKVQEALVIEKMPEPSIAVMMSNTKGQQWLEDFAAENVDKINFSELNAAELDAKLNSEFTANRLTTEASNSLMKFKSQEAAPKNPVQPEGPEIQHKKEKKPEAPVMS